MGLSTHILDTALGKPAANVAVQLFQLHDEGDGGGWEQIGSGVTDSDGRCKKLLGERALEALTYKVSFATAEYFRSLQLPTLYPYIEIVFSVANPAEHYHIPLLLAPNGYTTYRGS